MGKSNSKPRRPLRGAKKMPAATDAEVRTARAATKDELEAIARAQQGQLSAESFWKAAGRLTKLR